MVPNPLVKMLMNIITTLFILLSSMDIRFFSHSDGSYYQYIIIIFITFIIVIVTIIIQIIITIIIIVTVIHIPR